MTRLSFTISSDAPRRDADTLAAALSAASRSDWPIPGDWRIGWAARRVTLMVDIPATKKAITIRTGMFRWQTELIDTSQADFAYEQIRQRWPASIPLVSPILEAVTT